MGRETRASCDICGSSQSLGLRGSHAAEAKRLDPLIPIRLISAREAWTDAGEPEVEPERLAVDFATGIGGSGRCSMRMTPSMSEGQEESSP